MLFLSVSNARLLPLCHPCIAAHRIDGVEIRFDSFSKSICKEILALKEPLTLPLLFTLKKPSIERIDFLASLRPDYIDLEYDTDPLFIKHIAHKYPAIKILLSYHNFEKTPADLPSLAKRIYSPYAYAYKIATWAHSTLDALQMLDFLRSHAQNKMICLCMGAAGIVTRILGRVYGNWIDFAALSEETKTAPGQLTAYELDKIYHYHALDKDTALYGLIGDPIDISIGHRVHNAALQYYGSNSVYVKMRVTKEELAPFLDWAKILGFSGLSVTAPLKEAILPHLQHLDGVVKKIGAVNTLVFKNDALYGFNTDGIGALEALETKGIVRGKKILLLGAGGAARGIAFEAQRRGATLLLSNRTPEHALSLSKAFTAKIASEEELYDILINATSVTDPIDFSRIRSKTVVMDIKMLSQKYTPLLAKAAAKECTLVFGYEMFCRQALYQLRLWLEREINLSILMHYFLASENNFL